MSENRGDSGDGDLGRLLRAAGPRAELPADLARRWEDHFRSELAAARPRRGRRALLATGGLAAMLLVAMTVWNTSEETGHPAIAIEVQAVAGRAELELDGRHALAAGQSLPAGAVVVAGAGGGVAISWAGYDLRLREHTRLALGANRLELLAGEVYVSDQGRRTALPHATVVTPFGTVSDLGTQFRVRLAEDAAVASVRRGSILVDSGAMTRRAHAAPGRGAAVQLNSDRSVVSGEDDGEWRWIYALAPTFRLEGSSVLAFLRWSTAESGQELRFSDEGVALAAGNTYLSGTIDLERTDPERAVGLVLSTTRFRAQSGEGVLLVSRGSE